MKATAPYIALLALVGFLYLSSKDYEEEVESAEIEQQLRQQAKLEQAAEIEQQLRQQAKLEQAADSLGLTGQDWIDFVNRED